MQQTIHLTWLEKTRAYFELLKFRLSFLVAFSAAFGYIFGSSANMNWLVFTAMCIASFCIASGSIIINQILEKEVDKLMQRTQSRPLPTQKISIGEAIIYTFILISFGFFLLWMYTNLLTLLLALLSLILYGFVYTPLKKVGPIAVLVGAIPGALPPLLGWTAATGYISYEALIIFGIQFIWQFPHFWAIAWVLDEDYQRAGFKLLPSKEGRGTHSAIQIMIYTLFLIPLGLLPSLFHLTGLISGVITTICGCLFLAQTFSLMRDGSRKSALRIMFGSFLYLPVVQIAFLLDKL